MMRIIWTLDKQKNVGRNSKDFLKIVREMVLGICILTMEMFSSGNLKEIKQMGLVYIAAKIRRFLGCGKMMLLKRVFVEEFLSNIFNKIN